MAGLKGSESSNSSLPHLSVLVGALRQGCTGVSDADSLAL